MLREIELVRKKFGLEPLQEATDLKRRIHGRLMQISNIVHDLRPKTLESYGRIDDADKEVVGGD